MDYYLINIIKKCLQSLDSFIFIHYLCTDISQGRTFLGGQAKLGSITFTGGAFVIFSDPKTLNKKKSCWKGLLEHPCMVRSPAQPTTL